MRNIRLVASVLLTPLLVVGAALVVPSPASADTDDLFLTARKSGASEKCSWQTLMTWEREADQLNGYIAVKNTHVTKDCRIRVVVLFMDEEGERFDSKVVRNVTACARSKTCPSEVRVEIEDEGAGVSNDEAVDRITVDVMRTEAAAA